MNTDLLHESSNSRVLHCEDDALGEYVLKILNDEFPSLQTVHRFGNEYDVLSGLDIPGVRRVIKLGKQQNFHALYLEYIDGITLADFSKRNPTLEKKLQLAASAGQILAGVHEKNIVHKDISPTNILVDPVTMEMHLIDFGISSKFNLRNQPVGNPEKLEGTLTYISPEQTGRMNRVVDYRADLYSLGVVLYALFCGHPPFVTEDAMGLVHAHLAHTPDHPHTVNPDVPQVVGDIIMKLLAKNAEDRYQSANGFVLDIERCRTSYRQQGKVTSFEIANEDFSGKFQLVQKLYGRDQEITALLQAFGRVGKHQTEFVVVAGYSGTGKSSLVHEIYKPITERRGYFVQGKFDQFKRSVPYFAILEAFEDFVNVLLTEDEQKLTYFRERILMAVGEEGGVLTDVIPNLELIIGQQSEVPEVGGTDAQNRFNYFFRKFLQAISTDEHPVVLFIDDLQWADSASLNLLKVIITDQENQHFLCLGAYRDNEVSQSHPFMIMLEDLRADGYNVQEITIDNLTRDNVNDLISDSLAMPLVDTWGLTDLVMEKTGGNAFFVTQFLMSLYEEELLVYDHHSHMWTWNIEDIRGQNLTDDVVELMAGKVLRMSQATQNALQLAACIGSNFELSTLTYISDLSSKQVAQNLESALAEGLVLLYEDDYSFSHDRVQQAVYTLIPTDQRNALHLKIGRLLLDKIPSDQQDDHLFEIVNQLNWGIDILDNEDERETLAQLNLRAGIKAKESSAFDPAYAYIQNGIRLLKEEHWTHQYDLSIELYTEASETAFLSSQFLEMNQHIDTVLDKADSLMQKIRPYEIRILSSRAENQLLDALNTGFDLMEQLGEKFLKKPTPLHVIPDLIKTQLMLRGKSNETLRDLPEVQDSYKRAAIRVLAGMAPSSYWANPNVFPFIIFRMVQLSIRYGNSAISAFGFATFGVIMVGVLGLAKVGYRFGKLGLMIIDKYHAKEWIAQVYTPVYALINIWNEHVKHTLKPLQDSYHIGLETGAIEFACINANIYCIHAYLIGRPLGKLEEEARDYSSSFAAFKQDTNNWYNETFRQGMLNLMGECADPCTLTGDAIDEALMLQKSTDAANRMATFLVYFNKVIVCNFYGEYETSWEAAVKARPLLDSVLAKLEVAYFHFHEAIAAANVYALSTGPQKRKLARRVRANTGKMRKWAKHAPSNYLHKWYLLRAEFARANGKVDQARKNYDQAILYAQENEYFHEQAWANELAASFYKQHGNENQSGFHVRNALQLYREWEAEGKVAHLGKQYPDVVANVMSRRQHSLHGVETQDKSISTTTSSSDDHLDLNTVLKASASISGEIVFSKLISNLMQILLENLGATRGVLMLNEKDQLMIQAVSNEDEEGRTNFEKQPVRGSNLVPESIVAYVRRTGQELVVDHAPDDSKFGLDPYIASFQPLSILAYPIMHKGKFTGALYFENNLAGRAFTSERIELLSLLSGQIAISIENARLYENLEQKVRERTAELVTEKKKSDELLLNILPESTAAELKEHGSTKPRYYEHVTVMFTDFKDFTQISETLNPEVLVSEINTYFTKFDEIVYAHGIEKIKTIGDAYMCAGGLPEPGTDHPEHMIMAAIEIRDYMLKMKLQRENEGAPHFAVRIGIHTGPVVAGVVGMRKFAYDIWGDTVNTASRLESNCEPWKINVSGVTAGLIEGKYQLEYRGKIEAKNKGKIDMYYVHNSTAQTDLKQL